MPLYDYDCERCGGFRDWGSLAGANDPHACPECGRAAARAIATPHMRCGSAVTRYKAEAHNERNANEPKVVQHVGHMGQHKHGGHKHGTGKHKHGPNRPWMVGH